MCMNRGVPARPARGPCNETQGSTNYTTPTLHVTTTINDTGTTMNIPHLFNVVAYNITATSSTTTGATLWVS